MITVERFKEIFDNYYSDAPSPDRVVTNKDDLNAFIMLHKLNENIDDNIVCRAIHDNIYMSIPFYDDDDDDDEKSGFDKMLEVIDEEWCKDLRRFGVMYDSFEECFYIYI